MVRSADWIKLCYENQKQGDSLATVEPPPFIASITSTTPDGVYDIGADINVTISFFIAPTLTWALAWFVS